MCSLVWGESLKSLKSGKHTWRHCTVVCYLQTWNSRSYREMFEVKVWFCLEKDAGEYWDHDRALSHTTRALLNKDKVMYVKNFSEGVKGHFNGNNLRLACRAQKVCLKPALRVKPIWGADSCIVLNTDSQRARWAEYLVQLYMTDPSRGQLPSDDRMQIADVDPPIDETAASFDETT